METDNRMWPSVSKIAILNPYLQGGHTQIAETEAAERYIQAAKNLSIKAEVCANKTEIECFDPDLVISMAYQEGKLTRYPSYVSLNIPVALIKDVPRFIRNILSYDGFLTLSSGVADWLRQLCILNKKQAHIGQAAFSVPKTDFQLCDFKNAIAMYVGTNWDGLRHNTLFEILNSGKYLKCFGPKKSWSSYSDALYGGEIPFDARSIFNKYRQNAVGLCVGHPIFDQEGVASSRLFEIAASGALPICTHNELTKNIYEDSVLYLDQGLSTQELAEQIIASVQWIRDNPKIAQEMAKQAHDIFNYRASMEFYIHNLVELHKQVMTKNGYLKESLQHDSQYMQVGSGKNRREHPKVTYILMLQQNDSNVEKMIAAIQDQTYSNIDLVLIVRSAFLKTNMIAADLSLRGLNIKYTVFEESEVNTKLFEHLKNNVTEWFGILRCEDRVFSYHTSSLINAYYRHIVDQSGNTIAGVFAGCLEFSRMENLSELMLDDHNIPYNNKARIKHLNFDGNASVNAFLINFSVINSDFFNHMESDHLVKKIMKSGDIVNTCEVTYCINVEFDTDILKQQIYQLQEQLKKYQQLMTETFSSPWWRYTAYFRKMSGFLRLLKSS